MNEHLYVNFKKRGLVTLVERNVVRSNGLCIIVNRLVQISFCSHTKFQLEEFCVFANKVNSDQLFA